MMMFRQQRQGAGGGGGGGCWMSVDLRENRISHLLDDKAVTALERYGEQVKRMFHSVHCSILVADLVVDLVADRIILSRHVEIKATIVCDQICDKDKTVDYTTTYECHNPHTETCESTSN